MNSSSNRTYVEYLSIGGEIALSLCAPMILGYWLDNRYGTGPWLLITGILTGVLLLVGVLVRLNRKLTRKKRE